jgi:high-affinity Fe2+/Pb2+ permease
MTNITDKIRNLIDDNLVTLGRDVFTYESSSSSKIFTLTESNVSSATIIVYKNGVVWASSNYSYSAITGKLTVTGTLTAGDSLEVSYSYYTKYSDTELQGFVKAAISYLVVEKYGSFIVKPPTLIFPTPTEDEENLLAVVASILIKGDVVSYRTPELTMNFERSDSKEKKIKKFIRQFKKCYGCLEYIDPTETYVSDDEDD